MLNRQTITRAILDNTEMTSEQKDKALIRIGATGTTALTNPTMLTYAIDQFAKEHNLCADGVQRFKEQLGLQPAHRRTVRVILDFDLDCTTATLPDKTLGRDSSPFGGLLVSQLVPRLGTGWETNGRRKVLAVRAVDQQDVTK